MGGYNIRTTRIRDSEYHAEEIEDYEYYMITHFHVYAYSVYCSSSTTPTDDEGCIAVSISERLVPSGVSGNHEYLTVLLSHECN